MLAIVTTCEYYHYYSYGRKIKIFTDHKSLIGLIHKPIDALSPRLQSMMLRLLKYDVELEYQPGKTMYIPDGLSRLNRSSRESLTENLEEFKV